MTSTARAQAGLRDDLSPPPDEGGGGLLPTRPASAWLSCALVPNASDMPHGAGSHHALVPRRPRASFLGMVTPVFISQARTATPRVTKTSTLRSGLS